MDSVTHIVLGAVIGEVVAGRRLGRKALVIGAVVNSLPDIDFLAAFWLDTSRDVVFHRGITHSIFLTSAAAVLLGVIARRVYRRAAMRLGGWIGFFAVELYSHLLVDSLNAYGTGWFEPFSHYRISFDVIFVADPLYSIWLGLAALLLVVLRRQHPMRRWWAWWGLLMSCGYLCCCIFNKWRVDRVVERGLAAQGVGDSRYFTTPTPFNSWLWYVAAADSGGYYIGYRSVFDGAGRPLELHWRARNDTGLAAIQGRGDVVDLMRFAQGYYTIGRFEGKPVFNVIRFGEIQGWRDTAAPFVFHYFLQNPADNRFIIQRGRWRGWDGGAWKAFLHRIEGR
jgi:inner membrane protein